MMEGMQLTLRYIMEVINLTTPSVAPSTASLLQSPAA